MQVTDVLAGEHGVFHLLVEQLDDAIDRCTTLARAPHRRRAARALAARPRAGRGGDALPVLREGDRDARPAALLRHEHEQMDRGIRALFRIADMDEMRRSRRARSSTSRDATWRARRQVMFTAAREALDGGVLEACGAEWAGSGASTIGVEPAAD